MKKHIVFMKKKMLAVAVTIIACVAILMFLFGGSSGNSVPDVNLTSDLDSEKLLYDDAFMDEMLRSYSVRSLTASLSRLGYMRGIDCHNRAHEMGRRAYELFGGVAFKSCGIECHSGCRHGATEAFFAERGTADLIGSMQELCGDEVGNRFHMHQCVHGVGHGLMAWYDYDLYDALAACDLIQQEYHQKSCYSGVFMENIVGSIGQDEAGSPHYTKYLSDDPHYPCNAVADKYKHECYWLQTDQMHRLLSSFDAIGALCAEAPEPFRFACFHSMGRTSSGQMQFDPVKSYEVCESIVYVPGRNWCAEGALNNLMWDSSQADGAIEFCALSLESSFEEVCYDRLVTQATEVIPRAGMREFCDKLPEQYQEECFLRKTPRSVSLSVDDVGSVPVDVAKMNDAVIRYTDGKYVPDVVHVSVGQEVVWVNEDEDQLFWPASNLHPTHAAYPGSDIEKCGTSGQKGIFDACKELPYGTQYSFVFTEVGQWRYHDHVNPRAVGTVIVSE